MVGGVFAYFFPLPPAGFIFSVTVACLGFTPFTGQARLDERPSRVSRVSKKLTLNSSVN
jgi:hypothetical protein